jgi:hypothetical protein
VGFAFIFFIYFSAKFIFQLSGRFELAIIEGQSSCYFYTRLLYLFLFYLPLFPVRHVNGETYGTVAIILSKTIGDYGKDYQNRERRTVQ